MEITMVAIMLWGIFTGYNAGKTLNKCKDKPAQIEQCEGDACE